MKCPLTKGHYCGKHIQVMTSSWCQLILGKIWKPAVRSSRLAVMKITKHGYTLRWRHNGCDSVPNHQPRECLLRRLIRRTSKKTSKLRVTGLCAGNSPETGEFPAQMASNAENVSIWWRHHGVSLCKASTFSIVSNFYEPWAKGTNFGIYIPEITEPIDHGSSYHCNEWVLIVSTCYVNIEAWVAMI